MAALQADLNDPTSLPAALVGIHTVIDCSTARPEEPTNKIDWEGKVALIQCAQVSGTHASSFELHERMLLQNMQQGVTRPAWAPIHADGSTLCKLLMQAMGIQRYIFFSIHNCERHPEVPLMLIKSCTEEYLKQSGLNCTIFRLCGFMQVRCFANFACGSVSSSRAEGHTPHRTVKCWTGKWRKLTDCGAVD